MPEWAAVERAGHAPRRRVARDVPLDITRARRRADGPGRAARDLRHRAGGGRRRPRSPSSCSSPEVGPGLRLDARFVVGAGGVLPSPVRARRAAQGIAVSVVPQVHEQHLRREPGAVLRHPRTRHLDLLGVHERQPRHRLRLRGHPRGPPERHAVRRRRGDALLARGDLRHPLRDVDPLQRSPRRRARARSTPRATAWWSPRARRRSSSRARSTRADAARASTARCIGFGTSCDGQHVTMPSPEGMAAADEATRSPTRASRPERGRLHQRPRAPATEAGDIAESQATLQVLGPRVPISSTKGHTGHTLGACGALESAFCLSMMHEGFLAPTRNLGQCRSALRAAQLRARRAASTRPSWRS